MMGTQEALDSLNSAECPVCKGSKKPRRSLCYPCYKKLDRSKQDALYQLIGAGYEEAIDDAIKALTT